MDHIISPSHDRTLLFSTHKVSCNTYFLLSLTLAFSAITATVSTVLMLLSPGLILTLVGMYGLIFLTYGAANKPTGIIPAFAFTGFLGYILGLILNTYLSIGMGDVIVMVPSGTALMFLCCSAYVLTTRKDMSFLGGMLMAGTVVVLIGMVVNISLQLPALHLVINAIFILTSSGATSFEISNIIHDDETNYIRTTVSLYISLYNIPVSLLSILGLASRDQSRPGSLTEPCFMRGFAFCRITTSLIKVVKNYADLRR